MIGKNFTHYEILSELGSGGMGVVYKARDTKLDRLVALKFLPTQLGSSEEDQKRFVREAQSASALDHPNICTIYDIGKTDDGQMFIAMAFYDGRPLNAIIESGEIDILTAFDYARQVAHGLARAHEAGIVHRDIKPGNVIITDRGVAKIVDFGLAKSEGQSVITKQNSTLGTVAYMSPEQSRGESVDHRADIWALGTLLYEMIAGERPFRGTYDQAIIYSILNEDAPSLVEKREGVTPAQERIVKKCLAKNPNERYQAADNFLSDVESLSGVHTIAAEPASNTRVIVLGVVGLALVLVIAFLVLKQTTEGIKTPTISATRPLTGLPGLEARPVWSPDGTQVAYMSDTAGNFDVWLHRVSTQVDINLTEDHPGFDGYPTWSPGGKSIAFFSDRSDGGIFVLSVSGGPPEQISSMLPELLMESSLSWSPDGERIAFALSRDVIAIPSGGGPLQRVILPTAASFRQVSDLGWYNDSNRLMITIEAGSGRTTSEIWAMNLDGTSPMRLTDGKSHNKNPVLTPDERGLYFISDRSGTLDLWYQPLDFDGNPDGEPNPLTVGANIGSFSLTPDGGKIAYATLSERMNLWSIPITESEMTFDNATQLTDGNFFIEFMDLSPDGEWLAFDSYRSGNSDIWRIRSDGSDLSRVTSDPAHDWAPNWSADASKILFHSLRAGNRDIWMIQVEGGELVQVDDHPAEDYTPSWSPDDTHIAFKSDRTEQIDVWIMNSDGGELRQVTDTGQLWWYPMWSPDGSQITFSSSITGNFEVYTVSALGGPLNQVTNHGWTRAWPLKWSEDGSRIYICAADAANTEQVDLWEVSVLDGSARKLSDLRDAPYVLYNADTDGETFYGVFLERTGDLWEVDLVID